MQILNDYIIEEKKIKDNIPKRALMLEKASDDILSLPKLPSVLWKEIAEYEGGVEDFLLGQCLEIIEAASS